MNEAERSSVRADRPPYQKVVEKLLETSLGERFTPTVIGTPPLDIHLPSSDIDVACFSPNLMAFHDFCRREFGPPSGMVRKNVQIGGMPTAIVRFQLWAWPVELFCQPQPCALQHGVRHFNIEKRLLQMGPELRPMIRQLKQAGLKTEPAFARILGLEGDPYLALLDQEDWTDDALKALFTHL